MNADISWILEGLRRPGRTRKGIAGALGLHEAAITRLLKGRRKLRPQEIAPIAAYLGVAPPDIATSTEVGFDPRLGNSMSSKGEDVLGISGAVELGCFRERSPTPWMAAEVAPDPRHEDCRQSVYECRGDGAAAIGIDHGMLVVTADYLDFREKRGPIPDGRPVVLEARAQAHGEALAEWSVRLPRSDGDILHFDAPAPESARTLSARRSDVERGIGSVRVLGVVVAAIRVF